MNSKTGIELIAEERKRQIEKEGYCSINDAHWTGGELSIAAACYALNKLPYENSTFGTKPKVPKINFPWVDECDKRKKHDRKRSLIIAGALIAAELDRLIREENESEAKA